ncbi:MAG: hypothetical protein OXE78_06310 [Gammaproteobacteria bacterium]|nr:hypothetical protein [Gammaproteobacteria bacterium]
MKGKAGFLRSVLGFRSDEHGRIFGLSQFFGFWDFSGNTEKFITSGTERQVSELFFNEGRQDYSLADSKNYPGNGRFWIEVDFHE